MPAPVTETVHARLQIEGRGTIEVELNGEHAPITVGNFVDLVERGFYDGITFHRVVDNFVIQAGDPNSKIPDYPTSRLGREGFTDPETGERRTIPLEIKPQGADEPLVGQRFRDANITVPPVVRNDRGTIAMARGSDPNSASSQFYFNLVNSRFLDGDYAVFGAITDGLSVMDSIEVGDRIESIVMFTPEPPSPPPTSEPEPEPPPPPAMENLNITGPYLIYERVGDTVNLNNEANLETALGGTIDSPGGNVNLSGLADSAGTANFQQRTTLSGELNGEAIALSSLTQMDWLSPYGEHDSFAQKWLMDAWSDPGFAEYLSGVLPSLDANTDLKELSEADWNGLIFGFVTLAGAEGAQRFSNPNINYVTTGDDDGVVTVGLASHLNHPSGVKVSKIVRVEYEGQTQFLYHVGPAAPSGATNAYTGVYNLFIETPGPEPLSYIPLQFWRLPPGDRTEAMRQMPHVGKQLQRPLGHQFKGLFRLTESTT